MSEVVESSFGYHILLRLPLDKAAAADEVRDAYFTNFIAEQVDAATMATSEMGIRDRHIGSLDLEERHALRNVSAVYMASP